MKHISKDAYIKNSSALVLSLANEAKEKKAKGIKVIDASIGMLLNNDGSLSTFSIVEKALKESINSNVRRYSTTSGNKEFQENIIHWIIKDSLKIKDKYSIASSATIGGTGALYLSFRNYIDKTSSILLPDIAWSNYKAIAEQVNRKTATYSLFNRNHLNIKDIKNKINFLAKKEKRITILINDPCHNPTGYSLSKKEWIELINFFNEVNKKYPLTLILDVAYMDYSNDPRIYFECIEKIKANYLTLVAFSASKTLSIYGMRLGALLAIGNKEDINDFKLATSATVRTTWSSPNAHLIETFNKVFSSKKNYLLFDKYRLESIELVKSRYIKARKMFDKLLKDASLLPYKEGFFLTYKVKDANKVAESLKKKNIYVLPIDDKYIRIAACSLIN